METSQDMQEPLMDGLTSMIQQVALMPLALIIPSQTRRRCSKFRLDRRDGYHARKVLASPRQYDCDYLHFFSGTSADGPFEDMQMTISQRMAVNTLKLLVFADRDPAIVELLTYQQKLLADTYDYSRCPLPSAAHISRCRVADARPQGDLSFPSHGGGDVSQWHKHEKPYWRDEPQNPAHPTVSRQHPDSLSRLLDEYMCWWVRNQSRAV
ncbi:hypothetical protein DL766_006642 [Monosporascus sp. MC13-8B]|nr:hypothetical protein DL763_002294 [Monosporascus cannonballus]RYP26685.1 hypothetical protein DL766_006642 [Monosporascus sp. MC13-8B]